MTDKPETPPCLFCGEPTYVRKFNDGGCYECAVMCKHCDSGKGHGPVQYGTDLDEVLARAVAAYKRAAEYRDRLVKACQRLLDAEREADDELNYQGICEATELARDALRDFTLARERRTG